MKNQLICPKCQGRRFYSVQHATIPAHDSANGSEPLTVARGRMDGGRYQADVEAWVCSRCGFTELYTTPLANLEHMARMGKGNVRIVDATAQGGIYR